MLNYSSEHENYLKKQILKRKESIENKEFKPTYKYYEDLKEGLIHKYKDITLDSLEGYREFENNYGEGVKFIKTDKVRKFSIKNDFNTIYTNLKLIKGIGVKKEEKLKKQGYNTIQDLKNHKTYQKSASELLEKLNKENIKETIECIEQHSKTDTLNCISDIPYENFKFMDIETLGLSNTYIILLGVAEIENNKLISTQYFLKDYKDEPVIINEYFKHLNSDSVLVTFNGKNFDVPFINSRGRKYRIPDKHNIIHLDLMYYARKIWKDKLPNCKLQTIESEIFNYNRVDDVPGAYVPGFWKTYYETGNIGPVIPIIKHNRIDIVNLVCFLKEMCKTVRG